MFIFINILRFYIPKYKFHLTNEQNEQVHGRTCSEKIEKEFQLYETPSDENLKGLSDYKRCRWCNDHVGGFFGLLMSDGDSKIGHWHCKLVTSINYKQYPSPYFVEMVEMPENSKNIPGLYLKHDSNDGSWVRGSTSTNYSKNDNDYHRKLAFHAKENDILKVKEGIIPRYAGL